MDDWKKYNSIKIDGKRFSKDELVKEADKINKNPSSKPYQISFWTFIKSWFDFSISTIEQKTSGSTGVPKLIALQKQYMVKSAIKTTEFFSLKKDQNALLCLSSDFVGGKMMIVRSIVAGLNLKVVEPKSNPLKYFVLESEMIHFCAMVPLQLYESIKELNFDKIRNLIIGGAPVEEAFIPKLQNLKTRIYATYGMTETVSHIALKKLNHYKESEHYFETLPNVQISLDMRNCLKIDAPDVCSESIQTNDIVEIISINKFQWLGRFDNVINSGGVKIYTETLEAKISSLLKVQIYLGSEQDERFGERLVLVLDEKAKIKLKDLNVLDFLKENLTNYETAKRTLYCKVYPLSKNGKILRKDLKEMIESGDVQ